LQTADVGKQLPSLAPRRRQFLVQADDLLLQRRIGAGELFRNLVEQFECVLQLLLAGSRLAHEAAYS
jgi:hypothetical protein